MSLMNRFFAALLLLSSNAVFAAGGGGDPDPEGMKYYELFPNLVTNYQRTDGKVGYLSVGIQLKIKGATNLDAVKKHTPLLQDAVVWLMRAQTEDTIKSVEHREVLRQETLKQVSEKIQQETTQEGLILDVLFTKYIWQ